MKITRHCAIISVLAYFSITHCPPVDMKADFAKLADKKPEEVSDWLTESMKTEDGAKKTRNALTDLLENEKTRQQTQEIFTKGMREVQTIDAEHVTQKTVTQIKNYLDLLDSNPTTFLQLEARLPEKLRPTEVLTKLTQTYAKLLAQPQDPDVKTMLAKSINQSIKNTNSYYDAMIRAEKSFIQKDKATQFAENIIKTVSNAALRATYLGITEGQAEFLKNIVSLAGKATHDYRDAQGNIYSEKINEHLPNVINLLKTVYDFQIGTNDPHGTIKDTLLKAIDSSNILTNLKNLKGDARLQLKSNQIQLLITLIKSKKISIDANAIAILYEQVLSPEAQKLGTTNDDRATTAYFKELLNEELQLDKKEGWYANTKKELVDALKTGNYQAKLKEASDIMAYRRAELTTKTPDELRQMTGKDLVNYWEDWKLIFQNPYMNPTDNINALSRVLLHMNENYHEGVTPENLNAYFAMSRNLLRYAIENKVPSEIMEKALAPITWLTGPGGALSQSLLLNNITLKQPAPDEKAKENRATILSRDYIQTLNTLSSILASDAFKKTNSKSRAAVLALQRDAFDRLNDTNFRTTIFTDPLVTDAMRSTMFKSAVEMAASAEKAGGQKLSYAIDALQKTLPQSLDKNNQIYVYNILDSIEKAAIDPQQKQQLNQTRIDLTKALVESKLEGLSADQKNIIMTTIRDMVKNNIPGAAEIASISTDMLTELLKNHTQELAKPLLDFINRTISKANPTSAELSGIGKTFAILAKNKAIPFDDPLFSKLAESPAIAEIFQTTDPEILIGTMNTLKPAARDTLIRNLNQSLTVRGNDPSQRKDVIQLLDQILYVARDANQSKNYNESITWYTLALSHLSNETLMTELLKEPLGNKAIDPSSFSKGIDALIQDLIIKKATIDTQNIQALVQNLIRFASTIKFEQRSTSKQESTIKENIIHAIGSALMLTKDSKLFEPIKEKMLDASLNGMIYGIFNDAGKLMLQEMYRTPLKNSARYEMLGIFEQNVLSFLQNGIMFDSNHLMNVKNELIKIRSMLDDSQKITTKGSESSPEAPEEMIMKTKLLVKNELDSLIARFDVWDAFNKKNYPMVVKRAEQAFTEFPVQGEKGSRLSFAHDFIKRILPDLIPNLSEKDATKLLKVLADPAAIDQLPQDYVELMTSNPVADLIKKSNGHDALGVFIDLNEKGIDKSSLSNEEKKQILDFWNKALFPHGESSISNYIKGFLKP